MIPDELKVAVSALSHKTRWEIIEALQQSELSYTELLKTIDIPKGSLNHHLIKIMEAGLIDNYSQGEFSGPYSSYYRLSSFGKNILRSLLSSVEVVIPAVITKKHIEKEDLIAHAVFKSEVYEEKSFILTAFGIPQSLGSQTCNLFVQKYINKEESKYSIEANQGRITHKKLR